MTQLTWWTWVWASSGSCWWTGKPGVLQSMTSRFGHNWTENTHNIKIIILTIFFLKHFLWLHQVLVAASKIFGLCCSTWDFLAVPIELLVAPSTFLAAAWGTTIVPWQGMEPRPTVLGTRSLSHWTTRKVPILNHCLGIHFSSVIWCNHHHHLFPKLHLGKLKFYIHQIATPPFFLSPDLGNYHSIF